jgi:hypothetical protein
VSFLPAVVAAVKGLGRRLFGGNSTTMAAVSLAPTINFPLANLTVQFGSPPPAGALDPCHYLLVPRRSGPWAPYSMFHGTETPSGLGIELVSMTEPRARAALLTAAPQSPQPTKRDPSPQPPSQESGDKG